MIFFSCYLKFKELGLKKKHFSEWKKREYCKMEAIVWLDLENQPSIEGIISNSDFQFWSLRYSRFVGSHIFELRFWWVFPWISMTFYMCVLRVLRFVYRLLGILQAFRRFMWRVYEIHKKFPEYHKTKLFW